MFWNSSMPCFSPDGERIAWSADNWTGVGWQSDNYPDGPYNPSYWKPDIGQGSCHQIWIRDRNVSDDRYWFPATYWDWDNRYGWPDLHPSHYAHMHDKHYNPSWDDQP